MRPSWFYLLFLASMLHAETPAQRFRAAYAHWAAHRPDGMTWHDDSAAAVDALNGMWSAVSQVGVDFLNAHGAATAQDLSKELASLLPESDPRLGPPLSADSLEVSPGLFVVAFNSYPAGTVFAISRKSQGPSVAWSLSLGGAQSNDPRHLLASWHASRAGSACVTKNSYASGVCGPMTSVSLGWLPPTAGGQPRFFISATYAKDMGGTNDEQISIWRLVSGSPKLEWINLYAQGGEEETVPNGIEYKDGALLIAEKHEFKTFTSCGSCAGRQMVRHLRVTSDGVLDGGLSSVHPELDVIDDLFQRIGRGQPTTGIASQQVDRFLRPLLSAAYDKSREVAPAWMSVGMLDEYKLTLHGKGGSLCFHADKLGPVSFTLHSSTNGYFVEHAENANTNECDGGA